MVVQRILLIGNLGVGTTPSAEAKLRCSFILEKSIHRVIATEDSGSWGKHAGYWDNTLESEGSLKTDMIVY